MTVGIAVVRRPRPVKVTTFDISSSDMTLPVSDEVGAYLFMHCQPCKQAHLIAIGNPAMIFAPRTLLRVAKQVVARDMVIVTSFRAPQAAEIFLGPIRARAIGAVCLLMVDPGNGSAARQSDGGNHKLL
jgi:hypothetical protein